MPLPYDSPMGRAVSYERGTPVGVEGCGILDNLLCESCLCKLSPVTRLEHPTLSFVLERPECGVLDWGGGGDRIVRGL